MAWQRLERWQGSRTAEGQAGFPGRTGPALCQPSPLPLGALCVPAARAPAPFRPGLSALTLPSSPVGPFASPDVPLLILE